MKVCSLVVVDSCLGVFFIISFLPSSLCLGFRAWLVLLIMWVMVGVVVMRSGGLFFPERMCQFPLEF